MLLLFLLMICLTAIDAPSQYVTGALKIHLKTFPFAADVLPYPVEYTVTPSAVAFGIN